MKLLLINPPSAQILEKWDKPDTPHLGLAYLAAFVREKGVDVSVIDAKFERLNIDQVIEKAKYISPAIIGISAMTNYIKAAAHTAERLKEIFTDAVFLIGGAHSTALPKKTLEEFSVFDIAVTGEGEETLLEVVKSKPSQWHLIEGIAYRKEGVIVQNNPRKRIEDLNSLPFPAWDIFPPAKTYHLITSRGCPFRCIFCMRMHGSRVRLRSPENVLQEIKILVDRYNVSNIPIIDETFTISKERVSAICDLMLKECLNKKVTWSVNSRVTGVTYEMFKKMYEAGCRKIDFGIESGNEEMLNRIKKGTSIEAAILAVKWAKKACIRTHGLFILGHPHETRETIQDTINLIIKLNTTYISVGIMVPYPGTEVYKMAKDGLGGYRLISNNWDDYNKQIGNALELKGMDRKTLEKSQILAYLKFYLCNFRIISLVRLLFSYRRAAWLYFKKQVFRR